MRVPDTRQAVAHAAAVFFGRPSRGLVLVGVTGTNGKTTVTYLLDAIFSAAGHPCGVIGTISQRYGRWQRPAPLTTPESIDIEELLSDMAAAGVKFVAMEVSSHALDLRRVHGLDFDGAVFTNLSRDHLDYHRDMETYFASKTRLFTDCLPASVKERPVRNHQRRRPPWPGTGPSGRGRPGLRRSPTAGRRNGTSIPWPSKAGSTG